MNPYSLFSLGNEYNAIMQEIEDADGVLSPELEARLDAATAALATGADNVAKALQMIDHGIADIDAWIDRMEKRKSALLREDARWRKAAMENMAGMNINELEGELSKLRVCESESVAVDVEADRLPDRFVTTKVVRTPDKKAIKEALKAHDEFAVNVAHIERKAYLRVY